MKLTQEGRSKSIVEAQRGKLSQDPQNKGKRKTCGEINLADSGEKACASLTFTLIYLSLIYLCTLI
jgi:hypothetical protein